ncbi:MAG: hypothetical protein IPJ36_08625 [Simplicispira sp.]|nr:hypothetical protein [Simplicispira sp.]
MKTTYLTCGWPGPLGIAGLEKEDYRIGVNKNQAVLHSIISKGLDAIPPQEREQLERAGGNIGAVAPR